MDGKLRLRLAGRERDGTLARQPLRQPVGLEIDGLVEPFVADQLDGQGQLAPLGQVDQWRHQLEVERGRPCDGQGEAFERSVVEGVAARLVDEGEPLS